MSSSSAPRKPATASDSAATSKRPAEERAGDAKRRLGGDDPAVAKFAIQDDAGHILAVYESEARAYDALLHYTIVDYPVPAAATELEPEADLLSAAAAAAPTKTSDPHLPTCGQAGTRRAAGCPECISIRMAEIANYKAVAEAQGALLSMYGRRPHDPACCHKGLYEAAVGCTQCDLIAVQGTTARADAEFKNRPRTAAEQHQARCDGRLERSQHNPNFPGFNPNPFRCAKCGFEIHH